MTAPAELTTVIIDCADPAGLAGFYHQVTGWEIESSDADSAVLAGNGPVRLGFQRVDGYRPPSWPDPAKHFHLDLSVGELDVATKEVLALGATKPDFQPGGDDWVVLADPAGHPFCLVAG
jgi:predicted enzyme related to lactoylglutathione lyase